MPYRNLGRAPPDLGRASHRLLSDVSISKALMQKLVVVSQHYPPDPSTMPAIMAAI